MESREHLLATIAGIAQALKKGIDKKTSIKCGEMIERALAKLKALPEVVKDK